MATATAAATAPGDTARPLRVVMLTSSYPLFPGDTTAPFIEELAVHVAALGHEVHVVLPAHPRLRRGPCERGVHLHPFRYAPGLRPLQVWGYASALAGDVGLRGSAYLAAPSALAASAAACARLARRVRPDLLVAHWVIPNGPPAALVARAARLPLVVSLHGSDVFLAERKRPLARAARVALRAAAAVTACSPDLAARAAPLGADPARSRVIPYGVDPDRFRPADPATRAAIRRDLGLAEGERLVLAGGRLVHKKGLDVAVAAFAAPPLAGANARLVLFGDGDLRPALEAQVARLGLGGRVHFAGRVARDRLPALVGAADLFLLPSVHDHAGNVDGLPNTLLEALAAGRPVVASRVAGVPTVVEDGVEGLLVPEGDSETLAAAAARLLADPAAAARLGRAARARVERELTWPRVAARFVAAYRAVGRGAWAVGRRA
ncbi:MAG TPA: glycosyltransferase [Thermomicrobiales bacterium]|nr:glycosyltransferase [Thermomicrobiales bacterium]